jgi:hypothetical protein
VTRRERTGDAAERLVHARLRTTLPADEFHLFPNVRWCGPSRPGLPAYDGEADLVIAHADFGLLTVEVKSGQPRRDSSGRWSIGGHALPRSPFEQAEQSKRALVEKLTSLPGWRAGSRPRAGHAVAFPDVDLASLQRGHVLLGPDAPSEIVLDASTLETEAKTRQAVERAFAYWVGDGRHGDPPGPDGLRLIDELLTPEVNLRRLTKGRIEDDRELLLQASAEQRHLLDIGRSLRRVEVIGPAGSGKSMLAAAKAERLTREGYRTLLVCFNQRLATTMRRELLEGPDAVSAPGGLEVTTFHRLCETLGARAGVLPRRPDEPDATWWDDTLPSTLEAAIEALPGERFHAIVVDEGQDFDARWFDALESLLVEPRSDVLWVFHDPGQALYRDDVVGAMGLTPLELFENRRNPGPIAALAERFYRGGTAISDLRGGVDDDDMPHQSADRLRIIEAEPGRPTIEAVRPELHRLIVDEHVPTFRIAVLSGGSANASQVWRARRLGNVLLWNEAIDDAGESRRLPPEAIPDEPDDVVLFETVRRFKGLERDVVILCELPTDGRARLDELLYVGLTRATTALTIVAPPPLVERFRVSR